MDSTLRGTPSTERGWGLRVMEGREDEKDDTILGEEGPSEGPKQVSVLPRLWKG